jgi:hypothetical protein
MATKKDIDLGPRARLSAEQLDAQRQQLQADERRSRSRTFRVRGGLDEWLQQEAARTGRSVSEVIESHLELARIRRVETVEILGHDIFDIAGRMSKAAWHIEEFTGEDWLEDERTFHLFQLAVAEIMANYREEVRIAKEIEWSGHKNLGFEGKSDQELAKMFAGLCGVTPPEPYVGRFKKTTKQRHGEVFGRGGESTAGTQREDKK